MSEKKYKDEISALLEEGAPLSINQISEMLGITRAFCFKIVGELVSEDKILKLQSKSGKIYYLVKRQATYDNLSNMHTEIAKETIEVKDTYEDLVLKIKKIDRNVNGIYANIISIISIFVAIFALITTNANIVFSLTESNMYDVFYGIIFVNIFVVLCIVALLLGVKCIIINPILEKQKKKGKCE